MGSMKMYSVELRKNVTVPVEKIKYRILKTKAGKRKQAYADLTVDGRKISVRQFVKM